MTAILAAERFGHAHLRAYRPIPVSISGLPVQGTTEANETNQDRLLPAFMHILPALANASMSQCNAVTTVFNSYQTHNLLTP